MTPQTAQAIYNAKLNQVTTGFTNRLKNRIVNKLFNRLKKENPLIKASIGKYELQLPVSHELPFILKSFPHYSTNLARVAKQVYQHFPDLTLIDVGANIGDSVALLRTEESFPILCIEGDNYFFSILQKNADKFQDVYLVKNYVGETLEKANVVSVEIGGTAHLSKSATTSEDSVQLKKLTDILEDEPLFRRSKMLKIDTDGFDNKILRGSVDFLEYAKPVIFFEYDPFFLSKQKDEGLSIFDLLNRVGYRKMFIYENNGEFLISVDLDNNRLLEDIHHFYTGRKGMRYCDICVFHGDDDDLFNKIRKTEMQFFEKTRT